jgi:hypothetical protein
MFFCRTVVVIALGRINKGVMVNSTPLLHRLRQLGDVKIDTYGQDRDHFRKRIEKLLRIRSD